MASPFDQSTYQVRHEWGVAGLARLAPADIVVVVDVLRFSSTLPDAVASGTVVALADAVEWSSNGAAVAASAGDALVLVGGLRNASAVARAVQTVQERRQARTSVAVIAAGEKADDGSLRFAVEDQLGAGAVIAALTDLGIDHTAPDAAVAAEGFRALRRALGHLLSASGSARELEIGVASTARMAESGIRPASVAEAASLDSSDVVPVLREGLFVRFE
ncbi:2-phosphosulfolactate phosphatase [Microbacterium sp. NPDC012755]|uniref:2-phosphosulfolactate phosphatase n=1 Tax=Microbacterium sp. NPDC012755 TaxID=3364184 RepID=UPI003674856F